MTNIKIFEEELRTGAPNCNGGNYPELVAVVDGVPIWTGYRCGCWRGCSNTTTMEELHEMFPEWSGNIEVLPYDEFSKIFDVYLD